LNETRESLQIPNENSHRRNLGRGKIGGQIPLPPPQYFFYVRIIFLSTVLKRGKNTGVTVRGKGCMYIKDWFKPNFPLFLT
jgi:hypothetical protein